MKRTLPVWGIPSGLHAIGKPIFSTLILLFLAVSGLQAQHDLQITEIFSGQVGDDLTPDWFEVHNQGSSAWVAAATGELYYDDESASAADADIVTGITDIQPGEYAIVLITDNPADVDLFKTIWSPVYNLTNIKIGYSDGAGLGGGGDAVNIWIGDPNTSNPVDTESYPDAGAFDGQTYDVELAAFSIVGNANDAVATNALGGSSGMVPNIGSPGNLGPVVINPNAPIIEANPAGNSPYLNTPSTGPAYIGMDGQDPTDPSLDGIEFFIDDMDTPLSDLTVTATSSNQAVIPDANLSVTGTDSLRTLNLNPASTGYALITVTASDPDGNSSSYQIVYAVSYNGNSQESTIYHHGASDGSTALAVDNDYMWVADDESQTIRLFNRNTSGLPVAEKDFNADLGTTAEVDIEGSFMKNDTAYWLGSHTNNERSVIFSTTVSGSGANSQLTYNGIYDDLRSDLMTWDANNVHGLGADYLGFNNVLEIEGLSIDPNNSAGALLGFRGPLVNGNAIVVPVDNFQSIVEANPTANSAQFGAPIELDLEGHSIRSIECNDDGCLIIAGPSGTVNDFRLFTWTGNPNDTPELRAASLDSEGSTVAFEGIVQLPSTPFLGPDGNLDTVQLMIDTGTFDYYGDGSEAKDLPNAEWKKCKSTRIVLGEVEIPPVANPGDIVINEILQNPDAVGDSDGEWIELYNTTSGNVDINGWVLADADSDTITIDNGGPLVIAPGESIVLGNNIDFALNGGVNVDYAYPSNEFTLANGADEVILIATDGGIIDEVFYDGGINFPDPTGASMALQAPNQDNNDGTNWCVAMTPYGSGDLGTPGAANDCAPAPNADLQITEIWAGQDGTDLTADWFEITNFGTEAWVSGVSSPLYYDDDSQDPAVADQIMGITDIQPGESVIVVIDNAAAVTTFIDVWSPDYDLTGVEVGYADGSGLGQGGDGVTLFLGGPTTNDIVDFESYPAPPSGVSWDVVLGAFSQQGGGMVAPGTNIATATTATGGSNGLEPAIGSPGNLGPISIPMFDLKITEIFSGQAGDDLTEDWFEITNTGNAPWTPADGILFYDDESMSAADADSIFGITEIAPGATVVVLITDNVADITTFTDVWSPVIDLTGVEIGWTDGAGLGGGGDAVTLWVGDPNNTPADTASYPDPAPFDGQSYDVDLGEFSVVGNANGAVQTIATAGTTMDVPNIGSPGNGLAVPPNTGLVITEIFPGQEGDDLTADWFEIVNTGNQAWVAGVDSALYYDDESMSAADADVIQGITEIQPGASAIVLVTDNPLDVTTFISVWSPVIDLTGVQIGYTDGAGLGGGGDLVTLWLGDPNATSPIDTASYPDTEFFDGQSYDVDLDEFSVVGNANGAVQTIALGGNLMDVPNIGSPGNGLAVPPNTGLVITEIFPGQEGDDLTADWFEIENTGNQAWVAGVDSALYYDDESADPVDAVEIMGITEIQPGATAIVLITDNPADITTFTDVWSPVIDLTGVQIGYADGSGLGGGGDAVTLWLGDPAGTQPIDNASYPDTAPFDGQSYDVDLGEFSVVGNANGAVQTIALGGNLMDVPNIGSPGNGLAVPPATGLVITEIFPGQEGEDLTADWIEITNTGNTAWQTGLDPDLYYDDESADPVDAVQIMGITEIPAGESVIVLITDIADDTTTFKDVWSPVIDLTGVQIGWADGSGLGGGGDAATLWLGDPAGSLPIDNASYPDTAPFDGQSYDSDLGAFSVVGNANGAVATIALGGDMMDVPNIGSPGNGLAIPQFEGLVITEIFAGQEGEDLTADWFEIKNTGSVAWVAGVDDALYYDDESANPSDAVEIMGLTDLQPGEVAVVLITDAPGDVDSFFNIWSPVIDLMGVEIGYTDGSGLGGGGDAVTLWLGDPAGTLPVDNASYPDTAPFDGQSYDVDLDAFSVVGNANGAVQTIALGGDMMDVPNIGSPGNKGPIISVSTLANNGSLLIYPNPTSGWVRVKPENTGRIEQIQVFDMSGKVMFDRVLNTEGQFDFDLTNLPAGIYWMQARGTEGVAVERIIKN